MPQTLSFLIGTLLGGLIIGLAMTSRDKWKKGRGLMAKPTKQAEENKKKMDGAKAERAKGRAEVMWSVFYFLAMVVMVLLLGFFAFAVGGFGN